MVTIPANVREWLTPIANERQRSKQHYSTSRPLSKYNFELMGLESEWVFALETNRQYRLQGIDYGLRVDVVRRKLGDGGIDFVFLNGTMVDVKAVALRSYHLLREVEGKENQAEILVLAWWNTNSPEVELLGWEYDRVIVTKPIVQKKNKRWGTLGPPSYQAHPDELRPMDDLWHLLGVL